MNTTFLSCSLNEIIELVDEYISGLPSPIDSFFEDKIVQSSFFKINLQDEVVGYYAVFNDETLTQFFLKAHLYPKNQELLEQVLTHHPSIHSIMVPTGDEFLISTMMDQDFKMNKQAYFFQDSKQLISKEKLYAFSEFRQAELRDVEQIMEVSQDFFDRLNDRITDGEIFVMKNDAQQLVGIGIVEVSRLQKGYASVGMFVNEEFRQQGIGRTIIHQLKEWCYQHDYTPICGCWYYNTNSKLTLESAGMISKTRLLNFTVTKS
jgi:GNAT superfamily N-acetyltransferase